MSNVFSYLSNADLYRLSQVSKSFQRSIFSDLQTSIRYNSFVRLHKTQKENYKITPPSSPEKDSGFEDTSPGSRNYNEFAEIARCCNKTQMITKCRRCSRPSVVENYVAQCQDINRCGFVFCLKCNHFANHPRDFKCSSECVNAIYPNIVRSRNLFSDLSNDTITSEYHTEVASSFFTSPILSSTWRDSSGMFSGCENSSPRQVVKRNLTKSFALGEAKVLSSNNNPVRSEEYVKKRQRASYVPVVPPTSRKPDRLMEPSSPPKVKQYTACSKQSKRNLKRLTR